MKIERKVEGITLNQSNTIDKMLRKFDYLDSKPLLTPYDPSIQLIKNKGEPVSQLEYSKRIGSLLYLANKTRPDISHVVRRPSRYTHNLSEVHWNALEKIFKYLKGIMGYSLCYKCFLEVVKGFSDANWISDSIDVKSTSGYIFLLR